MNYQVAEDDASLDAEGFLERERRWMECIFAASRPEDLSCLFKDTGGSSKFNPDSFFPMVLNERVAWPEFMEMARVALFKQANATIHNHGAAEDPTGSGSSSRKSKNRSDTNDSGVNTTTGSATAKPRPSLDDSCIEDLRPPGIHRGGGSGRGGRRGKAALQQQKQPDHGERRQQDGSALREGLETRGREGGGEIVTLGGDGSTWGDPPPEATATPLSFGKSFRGTTAAGPDAWNIFRFHLPSTGPVLTVVLDAIDGDPELFVSRGRAPWTGSNAAVTAAGAAAAAGTGDWEGSSKHGLLRVVKIFPHDPK